MLSPLSPRFEEHWQRIESGKFAEACPDLDQTFPEGHELHGILEKYQQTLEFENIVVEEDYKARVEAMKFAMASMPTDPGRARDISEIIERGKKIHKFLTGGHKCCHAHEAARSADDHPGEGSRQAQG